MLEHLPVFACRTPLLLTVIATIACGGYSTAPSSPDDHAAHDHADHEGHVAGEADDPHAHHAAVKQEFTRSEKVYPLPEVTLVDQTGKPWSVNELGASERPVALNFIFTTCTTICPVMTAVFASTREQLGADADKVHMVSVSIDPQHDTPAVLTEYASKFDAPSDWTFLTGEPAHVIEVLDAFDAEFSTKLEHEPLTFLHRPGADEWVRLEGLGSATDLAAEVRTVLPGTE